MSQTEVVYLRFQSLPYAVRIFEPCWLIGSGADYLIGAGSDLEKPRDWDLLVEYADWQAISRKVLPTATPNTFGGWKMKFPEGEVDVWPMTLSELFLRKEFPNTATIVHLPTRAVLKYYPFDLRKA